MSNTGEVHYRSHSCIPGLKRAGCLLMEESLITRVNTQSNMEFCGWAGDYGTEALFLKSD